MRRATRFSAEFACLANIKNVFVVDPDIDIFSDAQMDWALATRFQPDRDLIVEAACAPCRSTRRIAQALASAARPGSILLALRQRRRLGKERYPKCRNSRASVSRACDAALADGPKYFEELMTALGSRDGREIVRTLDTIRKAGNLTRDERGRWALRPAKAGVNIAH